MFLSNILHSPNFEIDTDIIDSIFKSIDKNIFIPQKWTVNIVFVSPEEIKELNRNYRQKDTATDVLSFHYYEDFSSLTDNDIAGELIFCEEKIISQGTEFWLGTQWEFYKLLIHSLIHILWYDHETDEDYEIMKEKEETIWKNIF